MATIGKLVAVLTAKTQPFVRGLGKARKVSLRFAKSVARVGLQLVKMGAIAATAVVAGIALMVRSQLNAIDALAKLSKNLGITVDSLQALRLAASIGGLEIGKFDKALKKLAKAVNDASLGLTTYSRAFEALGLSADDLTRLKVDEIFKRIADAVQGTTVSVKLLGSIMDIFGARVGVELIEVMRQGRKGIEAFEREIRELGLSMSRVDTVQVEMAKDALTRLAGVLRGIAQRITVELSLAITDVTRRMIAFAKTGSGAGSVVARGVELMIGFWNKLALAVIRVIELHKNWQIGLLRIQIRIAKINLDFEKTAILVEELGLLMVGLGSILDKRFALEQSIAGAEDRFRKLREEAEKLAQELREFPSIDPLPLVEDTEDAAKNFKRIIESTRPDFGLPGRQGQFREVRLSRTALGKPAAGIGLSKSQELTNKLIEQIVKKLDKPLPVEIGFD